MWNENLLNRLDSNISTITRFIGIDFCHLMSLLASDSTRANGKETVPSDAFNDRPGEVQRHVIKSNLKLFSTRKYKIQSTNQSWWENQPKYLNFVYPVTGRRYFKTKCVHVTPDKLGWTGYGQTGLEFAHVSGNEARQHTLDRHTKMLGLQRQIAAKFLDKCLKKKKK